MIHQGLCKVSTPSSSSDREVDTIFVEWRMPRLIWPISWMRLFTSSFGLPNFSRLFILDTDVSNVVSQVTVSSVWLWWGRFLLLLYTGLSVFHDRECCADLLASASKLLTPADLLHWYQEWDCCYDYDEVHCKTGVGRTARKTIGRWWNSSKSDRSSSLLNVVRAREALL